MATGECSSTKELSVPLLGKNIGKTHSPMYVHRPGADLKGRGGQEHKVITQPFGCGGWGECMQEENVLLQQEA